MILGLQQKIKDGVKGIVDYYFDVLPTKEQYAKVEERPYEWLALYLNEDKYEFIGKLKMIVLNANTPKKNKIKLNLFVSRLL